MNFTSDTTAPVHPAVLEAHRAANEGHAASYGEDEWSARLKERLKEVFETDRLAVSVVVSGSASNALALSQIVPPDGAVLCHRIAHINTHERGAPEFYTGGAKLIPLPGGNSRIDPYALEAELAGAAPDFVHTSPPTALSLSNLTESGTAYSVAYVAELAAAAKAHGLSVHMDGARLANALAFTGASPADMTWRAGANALSFGLTKTGGATAEMVILFGELAEREGALAARRKRGGHMPPKARFAAAEALAMLEDGLWLDLAGRANAAAAKLAEGLTQIPDVELLYPVEGNLVFARLPAHLQDKARAAGASNYGTRDAVRLVCSWDTPDSDIEALLASFA